MLIKFPKRKIDNEVFDYLKTRYFDYLVDWALSSNFRTSVRLSKWLKNQVDTVSPELQKVADSIESSKDYDTQAQLVLKYIVANYVYKLDSDSWKLEEKWQTAEESIRLKTGDCEDFAIVGYVLCRLKGIPSNRLGICAGSVLGGGHCWLVYKPQEYPLNYTFLDWCYWPNIQDMEARPKFYINGTEIKQYNNDGTEVKSNYYNIWFLFNEDFSSRNLEYKYN